MASQNLDQLSINTIRTLSIDAVPRDPALEVTDRDVVATGVYQGRRRMTLTYPILNRGSTNSLDRHGR
jgi:hypothetical protein